MIRELVEKSRSYRRFYQDEVPYEVLRNLVDLARLTPSGHNFQPLKYIIVNTKTQRDTLFGALSWAGYLKDWSGPMENERPTAYLVMLGDKSICSAFGVDPGIAAQTICLGAAEAELGACIIGSVNKPMVVSQFHIPEHLEILLVIAIGRPREIVLLEPWPSDNNHQYWRDAHGIHHVPKRALNDIIVSFDEE